MLADILTLPSLLGVCVIVLVAYALRCKYGYGLSRIRGPTLAAYTDFWRFWIVWGRRPEKKHIALHEEYGPLVRLGPNMVSVSDPEAIRIIYALNAGFVKVRY